jgi:hypothetical protein
MKALNQVIHYLQSFANTVEFGKLAEEIVAFTISLFQSIF